MPLDALFLSAAAKELRGVLAGSRVDKIQMPERDVLLLSLRGPAGACKLLISAGAGSARVHLTAQSRENPAEPPMFCMLLRKHLSGARLTALEQPDMERVYILRFACLDELGVASEKKLVAELTGRGANLVLVDGEGRVLDCLRKLDAERSARPLLPGLFYQLPPAQDKLSVFRTDERELARVFFASPGERAGDAWLVERFSGISPLLARELVYRAAGETDAPLSALSPEALYRALRGLLDEPFRPILLRRDGQPFDVYCLPVTQYGARTESVEYPDFSALLDAYYTERERRERQSQRSQALVKLVKNRRERAARKLGLRREELKATAGREQWRQWGDIIKANIYRMARGQTVLEAEDFYGGEGAVARIPLEARLSPAQNAARYYKLYGKAKNAEKVLSAQILEAESELQYLESVLEELERAAGEKELLEIRQELVGEGFLKETGGKRRKLPPSKPLRFVSSAGVPILVGRNNAQNDVLTLRQADRGSLWFHAQKTHGAHVVAACGPEDEETVREAALLAAWFSKGRGGSNVPVDYTRIRYVKKPAGARPGMVVYTDYRTLYITPDSARVEALAERK